MAEVNYWINKEAKLMYRRVSAAQVDQLQVLGRDLGAAFSHSHRRVTFPSPDGLQEDLNIHKMEASNAEAWEDMMNEYLQINKEKLNIMNQYRQRRYEEGRLDASA